jgi:regulator of cell morphogenesis and NO signaling
MMEQLMHSTLADIVRRHHPTAAVFEKHQLDYCCKGKRPLDEACAEAHVDLNALMHELDVAISQPALSTVREDDPIELIGYILARHHSYVRRTVPAIAEHLGKVAGKHGDRYPHMLMVYQLFTETADELAHHMQKEEMILFPRIQEVFHLHEKQRVPNGFISAPAEVMEAEHRSAGNNLHAIRQLTNNYTPPADACTTHQLVIAELRDFEEDLHRHVHLENNVLFPLAERMVDEHNMAVA